MDVSFFLLTCDGGGGGVGREEERISLSARSWSEDVPVPPPPELLSFTEWKLTLKQRQLSLQNLLHFKLIGNVKV